MQARGGVVEQAVEHGDGVRAGDVLELVEGEHERSAPRLDGAEQDVGARRPRRRLRGVVREGGVQIEPSAGEGESEVGVEGIGVVVGEGEGQTTGTRAARALRQATASAWSCRSRRAP